METSQCSSMTEHQKLELAKQLCQLAKAYCDDNHLIPSPDPFAIAFHAKVGTWDLKRFIGNQ